MKSNLTYRSLTITLTASLGFLALTAATQAIAQSQQSYPPPQSEREQTYPYQEPMMGPGYHHHRGGMRGWAPGTQYGSMYDPNTVETIRGKVVSTKSFTPMSGMAQGMQLIVKSGERNIPVHVGPSWYLDSQGWQVTPNEEVEVTGSLVNWSGSSVMMASELRHGDQVWQLRDSNGIPLWRGSNRGGKRPDGVWGPCCW
jgi:hypothetical protein